MNLNNYTAATCSVGQDKQIILGHSTKVVFVLSRIIGVLFP